MYHESYEQRSTIATHGKMETVINKGANGENGEVHRLKADMERESIEYHYLTFDTTLPPVTQLSDATLEEGRRPIGSAPDLSSYIDPFEWRGGKKATLVALSCIATMFTAYAGGCYATPVPQMAAYWHLSETVVNVGLLIFTVGFAFAPMILAPLSEVYGRRPVFLTTGVMFIIFSICCGATRVFGGMMISRFLAGCSGSTFSAIVGGVVADIYRAEDRNTPMTFFTAFVIIGCGLGPLVSGFLVSQHKTWRWVFYANALELGAVVLSMFFFFHETRRDIILHAKANCLNEWYQACEEAGQFAVEAHTPGGRIQRIRWKVKTYEERGNIQNIIQKSLFLPFYLLFTEPIVFLFSLWMAFAWAILWVMYGVLPDMYRTVYGFNQQQQGMIFISVIMGGVLSAILSIIYDRYKFGMPGAYSIPERRLQFPAVVSILLPIGLFWFGWTSSSSIHWIVPTLAVSCLTIGISAIILAVVNYLADTYRQYSSSTMAAMSFCRNIAGGVFVRSHLKYQGVLGISQLMTLLPKTLFTHQMFEGMGYGGGASLLGGFAILLSLVPWVLIAYGPKIRARSKFSSGLVN